MAKTKTIKELTQTDFTALTEEIVGETTYALLQAVFLAEPFSLSNIQNFIKDTTNGIIHFSANVNKESRLIGNSAPATTGKLLKFYLFDVQIDVTTTERHLVFYLDDTENKTLTPLDLLKSFAPPTSTDPVDPDDEPLTLEGLYGASAYLMTLKEESIQDTNPHNPGATSIPYFFSSLDKETYDNDNKPILNKTQLEAIGILSYLAKSGLNFNIKSTFQDSLAKAIRDLGLSELVEISLEGSIQQTSSGSLWLEMAKPIPIPHGSFTLGKFQFTLTEIGFTSTVDYLGQEMPSILFTGKIKFDKDSTSPAELDVQITLSLVRQIITIEFIELESIGETFPEFAKAVGINNDTFSVVTNLPGIGDASKVFKTILDNSTFSQLELIFGISPFSLEADFTITTTNNNNLAFSLQSDTPTANGNGHFDVSLQPWFHLHYKKDPIASDAIKEIQMGGIWKLGSVNSETDPETEIDILIDLNEKMLYADMAVGNYLNFRTFGEALFPDVNLPENLILTDFELVADLTNKSFELEVGISNDWEISVANISFAFTELDLEVGYSHKALQYVYMEGMFEVAGIHFPVVVLYDKPNWIVRGGMQPGETIYFSKIYEGLIGSTYSDTALSHFTNINISELYLEYQYQTETGGFHFYTKLNEVLTISDTFKIEWVFFEIDTNQDSADVTVKSKFAVQIKPADDTQDPVIPAEEIDFFLNYEQNSQGMIFSGTTGLDQPIPIGDLIQDISHKFFGSSSITLPEPIRTFSMKDLDIQYNRGNKDFHFSGEADFSLGSANIEIFPSIEVKHLLDGRSESTFEGKLKLGVLFFELFFDKNPESKLMLASYVDSAGQDQLDVGETLNTILGSNDLPSGLKFALHDALFVYLSDSSTVLFLAHIGEGINLSNLPLVGKFFSADKTLKLAYQVQYASHIPQPNDLTKINSLLPAESDPVGDIKNAGLGLGVTLKMGLENIPLDFGLTSRGSNDDPDLGTYGAAPGTIPPDKDPVLPHQTEKTNTGITKWFDLQKKFGPVHFNRIGLRYAQKKLWCLFDAALIEAGLSLSLDGLGLGSSLTHFSPTFTLQGIGIDYQKEELSVSGSFLRGEYSYTDRAGQTHKYEEYDGEAFIEMTEFSLSAIGSYTTVEGEASLFIYALLNKPLGGPPPFFITGVAAGFGYNRRLILPGVTQVAQFPLVAEAIRGDAPPANPDRNNILAELEKLHTYIPPSKGDLFLTIGVKFQSFKLVNSFVLVALSLGYQLRFDLLGVSTALLPTSPDPAENVDPLAEIQMGIRARYVPDEGILAIDGRLTAASFILSRACHLTGGFAFYTWFKDAPDGGKAGDFVVTIGGYHPAFEIPAHYPRVPRLAFNWPIDSHTSISGDLYLALCSHALMAGGHLAAIYHAGALQAWFVMGADMMISWKPYHYDVEIYVDMGARFTYHFFGTHHITVHLGADLHIWGPDFGGHAKIHIWIVSIGVNFGNQNSKNPKPIDWDTFQKSFLPDPVKTLSVNVNQGLVSKGLATVPKEDTPGETEQVEMDVINPKELMISTDSLVPSTQYSDSGSDTFVNSSVPIGIPSMNLAAGDVVTKQQIKVKKKAENGDTWANVESEFHFESIHKNVPSSLWGASLWGPTMKPNVNADRFVEDALTGFRLTPATGVTPSETANIDRSKLSYDTSVIHTGLATSTSSGLTPPMSLTAQGAKNILAGKDAQGQDTTTALNNPSKITEKNDLLRAFGIDLTVDFSSSPAEQFMYISPKASLA